MNELVINKKADRIEVCVLENNLVCEMYVYGDENESIMGNIYKGTVSNIVDGMQAAFIDIGLEKNAFISAKDAAPKVDVAKQEALEDKISNILKVGDKIIVQIKKIPTEDKGARVSTHITIPGNYIVLMPNIEILTVSQKIDNNKEKERLLELVKKNLPSSFGAIIRTDAENVEEGKILEDIKDLLSKWEKIIKKAKSNTSSNLLYDEHELISKICRDLINKDTVKMYINDKKIYLKMNEYVLKKDTQIEYIKTDDLVEKLGLTTQIEEVPKRKVWLKCGGYIVIDKTEALTAIDVNSGKYTGKKDLEQTALDVNEEAAFEIMKQIRLKDIGGIIVVDYIDLAKKENQQKIINIMENEAKKDRSKIDIKGYTELNLVELTRKKMNM